MERSRAGAAARIAHVLPWQAVGGTEVATLRIADAAAASGMESLAFCVAGAEPVRDLFHGAGYETAGYDAVEPSYRSPLPFVSATLRLAREFRRRRVDVVHCADVLAAAYAGYAARLAGLPLLCQVRNRYGSMSRRDRSFLFPVQRFIFVSQDTWRHFALPVPARRGTVLYDGIELPPPGGREADGAAVRAELGIPPGAAIVGMVARVAPQKDYPTLVRAAARVVAAHPEARFVVVGDCSSTPAYRELHREIRELVGRHGLESSFVFTDHRSDVPRFIEAMDVFVLSTHWEGLPLVILEAMAHGKPVVATAVDGIPEAIADGETGFLYPHQDDESLATHVAALLGDPLRARAMGRAGRERVSTHFSQAAFAANVTRIYRDALGSGRADASQSRVAVEDHADPVPSEMV